MSSKHPFQIRWKEGIRAFPSDSPKGEEFIAITAKFSQLQEVMSLVNL